MADRRHDIEKYLKGELSPTERHALERQALDDQFLMDALEGAESIHPNDLSNDLKDLQQRLAQKVGKTARIVPLWVWPARIAAGLALLAVSTFVVLQVMKEDTATQLAKTETSTPEQAGPAAPSTDSVVTGNKEYLAMGKSATEEAKKPEPKPSVATSGTGTERARTSPTTQPEQEEVVSDQVVVADQQNVEAAGEAITESAAEEPANEEPVAKVLQAPTSGIAQDEGLISRKKAVADTDDRAQKLDIAMTRTSADKVVRGKVTTEDGVALPGVNVMIKGSNTGTTTDVNGNYQIPVPTQESSLTFSFIGMESKEVDTGSGGDVNVELDQDVSQLSEVVVVGYGSEAKDAEEIPPLEFAAPDGGRIAYKQYLEKNLMYPEQALENKVEGRVTIQFTIQPSGQLTDFKILKGIGFGCDEEVIRLIRQGPKWTPTKRDTEAITDKVKVRMRFRMPKK